MNRATLFRGLFQGVGSVIIATLPSSGAFFITYEGVKHTLSTHNPNGVIPQPLVHATASGTAELVSCTVLTPAEVIKQNAQVFSRSSGANATLHTLQRFRANPLGLWRGYTALAGRNLPFTAMQFPLFEHFRALIKEYRERTGRRTGTLLESGLVTATSAGAAGSISAVITTPIDVVKTRIMLSAAENAAQDRTKGVGDALKNGGLRDAMGQVVKKPSRRKSSLQVGKEIFADQGVKGLWRGGAMRGTWTILGSGLYLGTYESGRIWLASRRGEKLNEEDLL